MIALCLGGKAFNLYLGSRRTGVVLNIVSVFRTLCLLFAWLQLCCGAVVVTACNVRRWLCLICCLASTLFSRAKIATTVGTVLFLATFFPFYAVTTQTSTFGSKQLTSLLPNVAFALSLGSLSTLEDAGVGVTSSSMGKQYDNYTFGTGLGMLFFDFFLFTFLGFYLNNGACALIPWGSRRLV